MLRYIHINNEHIREIIPAFIFALKKHEKTFYERLLHMWIVERRFSSGFSSSF